jgi:hypothetical protein
MLFEQGPIRPPSEAGSLLLRFTRNCPWNQCRFCPVYKGQPFSRRSIQEIRADIDAVRAIIDDLRALSIRMGQGGEITGPVVNAVLADPKRQGCDQHVAAWAYGGRGTVFIQDANSLLLDTGVLVEALEYLRRTVPGVKRVTSYARSQTLARKPLEDHKALRAAGLDRVHIGMESGSNAVLAFMRKGATAAQHIDAGVKVVQAGMTLSEYIMPGLGGRQWTRDHALETARVLNAIDPHFIRLRSLRIPPQVPLHEDVRAGRFVPLTDDETVQEIHLLVETLHSVHSTLTSDHIMNLLAEVEGKLPDDREKMLGVMDRYLALPDDERLLFRLGRRGGALHALDDLLNPAMRARLERARRDLEAEGGGDIETIIRELADRYI